MIAILLGVIVGVVLGLTGAGGSIFAVPLLMLVLGWRLTQATPVALMAVCGASLVGTIAGWRSGQIYPRAALLVGVFGVLAAPLGIMLASHLRHDVLVASFAVVMCGVAVRLIIQARVRTEEAGHREDGGRHDPVSGAPVCRLDESSRRILLTAPCKAALALSGAVTGILSGALGVGAGFVVVPALRATTQLSVRASVATSLMAISIISASAVVAFLVQGGKIPLPVAAPFLVGALAGMLVGRTIAPHVSGPLIQQLFALLMLVAAISMVYREYASP